MPRYENRVQKALALVVGLLLLANLFTLALVALTPATRVERAPVLLALLLITLIVSVPSLILAPRWLMKPYRQLVDEAERAPVRARGESEKSDETEFVLKTFQEVVAELGAKQRELERLSARASARAASAEEFNERIVASIPSGLIAIDASGSATVINAPAKLLLGIEGSHEGRRYGELLKNAPELSGLIENCFQMGEVYRREEIEAVGAGGDARRLGVTIAPIEPHEAGEGRGALCLLTDITEVLKLRETVALKRNLESLGEMAAGLSHEFKNALATLHGYAQLLQTLSTDERGRGAAAALLQEVRNLSEMVTAFLNFARPKPLDLSEVSLAELVNACASDLETLLDERNVSLRIEGDFPSARADERMLRQALINIIRNAVEAITDDAKERRVTIRCALSSDPATRAQTVLEVEDTGPGISKEDLRRIFIPFFTTKTKGHGVGLALAHRVVTDHGGTLDARNSAEGGAVFILRLPH